MLIQNHSSMWFLLCERNLQVPGNLACRAIYLDRQRSYLTRRAADARKAKRPASQARLTQTPRRPTSRLGQQQTGQVQSYLPGWLRPGFHPGRFESHRHRCLGPHHSVDHHHRCQDLHYLESRRGRDHRLGQPEMDRKFSLVSSASVPALACSPQEAKWVPIIGELTPWKAESTSRR